MPKGKKNKKANHVIKPGKSIVASMAENFRNKLLKMIEGGIKELVIDFDGVDRVDSMGIGVLVATHNSLTKVGGRLSIINVPEDMCKLFAVMRLNQHFEIKMAN